MRKLLITIWIRATLAALVVVALLACASYAAKDTSTMKHWHPMFIESALNHFGISFFGHEHTRHYHPVSEAGGAFIDGAPITSCWHYDFLEKDCDGPDHFKALLSDGEKHDSRIGAYKGQPWDGFSPPRAKACATNLNPHHVYCVSDYVDDGEIVWLETHHNLESHTLAIGCPGPRLELPCTSRDP